MRTFTVVPFVHRLQPIANSLRNIRKDTEKGGLSRVVKGRIARSVIVIIKVQPHHRMWLNLGDFVRSFWRPI